MRWTLIVMGVVAVATLAGAAAQADEMTQTLADTYWGGVPYGVSSDQDVLGGSEFVIDSATVYGNNSTDVLTVTIYTDFIGTTNQAQYGDLFLSTDGWSGTGSSPWANDYVGSAGHEAYEYAVTFADSSDYTNTSTSDSGSALLYQIGDQTFDGIEAGDYTGVQRDFALVDGSIVLSDWFFNAGYRQYQEVRYSAAADTSETAIMGTHGWELGSDSNGSYLQYSVVSEDLVDAFFAGDLGVHWTMTCANDVLSGGLTSTVPEPGSILLLSSGLISIGVARRRRRKALS